MSAIIPQQHSSWQKALRELITTPTELLSYLNISPDEIPWDFHRDFPLRVPKSFVQRMRLNDPNDPLLRQVLTMKSEKELSIGFSEQPLEEQTVNPVPGLLHKFKNRVLVIFTSSCAIHCRYCFRRHFPYADNNVGRNWADIFAYIQARPEIEEVILSGGDPLMAQNEVIAEFLQGLQKIAHVKMIRFHTRLPVVIPERIDTGFIEAITSTSLQAVMVYHINHAQEITPEIAAGVALLKQHHVTIFNQAVLLRDVNDNAATLVALSRALFKIGILPYYLNLLDRVAGAHEFDVSIAKAKELQQALREQLPGYLVPRFVKEIPQQQHKIPLDWLQNT